MNDGTDMTSPETTSGAKREPKTERKAVATTVWLNAKGEAESPMDDVTKVTFSLDSLEGRSWSLDLSDARSAMEASGLQPGYINAIAAFAGFGFKTKLTNEASGIRNDAKLKGTDAASPEAQGAALDEFESDWQAGNWRAGRGEGESIAGNTDLAQAIFNFQTRNGKTVTIEAIKDAVGKADKDLKAKWRKNPDINAELLQIRAARAAAKAGSTVAGASTADDLLNIGG